MHRCEQVDHFFPGSLSVLFLKWIERNISLFKCYIDFEKAYDRVDQALLWEILLRRGASVKPEFLSRQPNVRYVNPGRPENDNASGTDNDQDNQNAASASRDGPAQRRMIGNTFLVGKDSCCVIALLGRLRTTGQGNVFENSKQGPRPCAVYTVFVYIPMRICGQRRMRCPCCGTICLWPRLGLQRSAADYEKVAENCSGG